MWSSALSPAAARSLMATLCACYERSRQSDDPSPYGRPPRSRTPAPRRLAWQQRVRENHRLHGQPIAGRQRVPVGAARSADRGARTGATAVMPTVDLIPDPGGLRGPRRAAAAGASESHGPRYPHPPAPPGSPGAACSYQGDRIDASALCLRVGRCCRVLPSHHGGGMSVFRVKDRPTINSTSRSPALSDATASERRPNSRLSCQLYAADSFGSLIVHLPARQVRS
jgi:hypothetical protein